MIKSLTISNYALIDNLQLEFTPGFNIITGETGAGKSIMLGALSMLFGNRADTRVVTDKQKKSIVEAIFDVADYPIIGNLLEENNIDHDDSELVLRREINPAGRSRAFINDTPVQLTILHDIAMHLVDIHSQHQNLLLVEPNYQIDIIDTLLPDQSVKHQYLAAYAKYHAALKDYQLARRALQSSRAEEDYFRFQLAKLDELDPQPGEEAELEAEQRMLANATDIKLSLRRLINMFSDDEDNISSLLRSAESETDTLEDIPEAEDLADRIQSLRIEAEDIASTIESIDSNLDINPQRLEQVEERLSEIYDLERKFSVDSIDGLINLRQELAAKLEVIDNGDERVKQLATIAKAAKRKALEAAATLSEARREVATKFAKQLRDSAVPLGMKNLQVEIAVNSTDLSPLGTDAVEFLFAFNKNQPLMPVKDTASGGEISRLMLVIKAIVANRMQLPTIIFDEIDTGVSGDVANRMGALMADISRSIQVISITHLPQVAAKGESHFKVYKEDTDRATNTHVRRLSDDRRIDELALMISGDSANPAARDTARSLLGISISD